MYYTLCLSMSFKHIYTFEKIQNLIIEVFHPFFLDILDSTNIASTLSSLIRLCQNVSENGTYKIIF